MLVRQRSMCMRLEIDRWGKISEEGSNEGSQEQASDDSSDEAVGDQGQDETPGGLVELVEAEIKHTIEMLAERKADSLFVRTRPQVKNKCGLA